MKRWWLVMWLLLLGACGSTPATAPQIGQPAPSFILTSTDGAKIALLSLRGKPIIVNFFATWCAPCKAEMPLLERTSRSITVIGVDPQETAAMVAKFGQQTGVSYPLLLDTDSAVKDTYRVGNLPTTFALDAQGTVRHIILGPLTEAKLNAILADLGAPPLR